MKNKTILIVVAAITLCGCRDGNDPETKAINSVNANAPEFIANTPKGKLYRINIDIGSGIRPDRIYFFENSNEVNINRTISSGKTTRPEATVLIDGVEYIRK